MRKRLRTVLHDLAGGRLSLSDLDELFTAFPFGEKVRARARARLGLGLGLANPLTLALTL